MFAGEDYKVLVCLSGGVESSALVQHGVRNGYNVECIHATWDNKTQYEHYQARKIADHYEVPYSNIIMNAEEFNSKTRPDIQVKDAPRWGAALLLTAPVDHYKEIWFGSFLGESAPGATTPAGAEIMLRSVGCEATICSPLYQMKKIDQWRMLDKEVKELVTSCNRIRDELTLAQGPCGDCEKCREWELHKIVRDA
tara:strand:+ start:107 stop:694 length:588 start_codon:yes stop_codon:yes gene_type:complete